MDTERIAAVVQAELERSRVPGAALAIVLNGEVAWSHGFGVASVETGTPMTGDTVFSVQSLSKPVVATALMQLHERDAFSIDDPANTHLDGAIKNEWEAERPVTVRDLLTHTSGLPDDVGTPGPAAGTPLKEFFAARAKTVRSPGSEMVYANWGYDALGLLVERFSSVAWDRYVTEHVCEPLGMTATSAGRPVEGRPCASGHFLSCVDDAHHVITPLEWPTVPAAPSGSVFSTVNDMGRFLAMHMNRGEYAGARILRPETAAMMRTLQAAAGPTRSGMGLGFRVTRANGRELFCHGGDGLGFTNFIGGYADLGAGLVLTLNRGGAQSARSIIANSVLGLLAGDGTHTAASAPDLSGVTGEYTSTYWDIHTNLTTEDGTLTATLLEGLVVSDTGARTMLRPTPEGRFTGEGGMFHGWEMELDCTEAGVSVYGGIYPFRFNRTADVARPDIIDENADLTGKWSGTIKTPLGQMPAQFEVSAAAATASTPLAQNVAITALALGAGRLAGSFSMTVPGAGEMTLHPRLYASGGRLKGPIYAWGWFGEIAMKANLVKV